MGQHIPYRDSKLTRLLQVKGRGQGVIQLFQVGGVLFQWDFVVSIILW